MSTATKSQPSRSKEARKARRIVRTSLRYAIMTTAPELSAEEQSEAQEKLDAMAKEVEASLDYLASIKREKKAKVAKANKKERARVEQEDAFFQKHGSDVVGVKTDRKGNVTGLKTKKAK